MRQRCELNRLCSHYKTPWFVETVASGAPVQGTPGENGLGVLKQGMLENSNVDIVEEMVNMAAIAVIDAQEKEIKKNKITQ